MTRSIPKLEDIHAPYAQFQARHVDLQARVVRLRAEAAAMRARIAESHEPDARHTRIEAIAAGTAVVEPELLPAKLEATLRALRDAEDAIAVVLRRLHYERQQASRMVSEMFMVEHGEMRARFWRGIAQACKAVEDIDGLHRDLHRAGVEPLGLTNPERSIFGEPVNRSACLAMELRAAARDGLITADDVPESLR